jgi:hypothetical protein
MSRPSYLRARDRADLARWAAEPALPSLGTVLAGQIAHVYRIRCEAAHPRWVRRSCIWVYDAQFCVMPWDNEERERALDAAFTRRPDVDWRRGHDYYPGSGAVLLSPLPWEDGYAPRDDRAFGGRPPVLLGRPPC